MVFERAFKKHFSFEFIQIEQKTYFDSWKYFVPVGVPRSDLCIV